MYAKRLKKILSTLRKSKNDAALLLSSAPALSHSRDEEYPYKQNSDLYYLTGSKHNELALFITTKCDRPVLFAVKDDKKQLLWQGSREDPLEIANRCDAELVYCNNIFDELLAGLNDIETLYFQNIPNSIAWQIAQKAIAQPSWNRGSLPTKFCHSDVLIAPMRTIKDASEIKQIQAAIDITGQALHSILPLITTGSSETEIAAALEYNMKIRGATPSFKSIVATGSSASILHYSALNRILAEDQLLMIDCGAEYNMYCGDISRTYPVNGKFTGILKDIYSAVLKAQKVAIKAVKPDIPLKKVHLAAAKSLTESLIELKVLKGKSQELFKKQAYLNYFPHSIGHHLGLDVHDLSDHSPVLKSGMVITIEPGLYFPKSIAKIPVCGIRIEDDVLVTKDGAKVLSSSIDKEINDIEDSLMFKD